MNVLYTCDNNYIWIMGISMISLFENNKHIEKLKVFLLGENISDENKTVLMGIANKYTREIIIIDVTKLDLPEGLVSSRWPLSAFTRLFCGELLPKTIDRILYLDCDTIIMDNIESLNFLDFSGNLVLGVKDCISGVYKKNIGLIEDSIYINAGVLLINLEELRRLDISNLIEIYVNKYKRLINYADQDILNGMFKDRIGELAPQFDVMTIGVVHSYEEIGKLRKPTNYYSREQLQEAIDRPVIIHYTSNMLVVRPWYINTDHPLADAFRRYMNISPWQGRNLEIMRFSSKESKIISFINKLPRHMAFLILGCIHSELKPRYIKAKSKKRN